MHGERHRAHYGYIGEIVTELQTPVARLVSHDDAPRGQQPLHVTVAQRKAKIHPCSVADDRGRIAVIRVRSLGVVYRREAHRLGRSLSS